MRPVASIAVLSIGLALVAVSLAFWPVWPLGLMGAVLALSVLVERRYRRRSELPETGWEPTSEKFLDEDTGQVMQVWYHPATGQRDYRPG
jgi:membrane protein implicated in regulation of membrane protease activity